MRSQGKKIRESIVSNAAMFDSVKEGSLDVNVPYLNRVELMSVASEASRTLGGYTAKFTRNVLEGWFRLGVLKEPIRTDRNRLFSIIDAFHVAVVLHLSTSGISLKVCGKAAEFLDEQWIDRHFVRSAHALDLEGLKTLEVDDFLVLSTHEEGWLVMSDLDLEQLAMESKRSAGIYLLNACNLFNFTVGLSRKVWDEKAHRLLAELNAELVKAKERESK